MLTTLAVVLLSAGSPALCLPAEAASAPPPAAEPALSPAASHEAIAERLSAWIAGHTAYPAAAIPPLRVVGEVALKARCFPAFPPHLVPRVMAAYDAGEGIVYLSESLDMSRLPDRSYLLHELVHHAQQVQGGAARGRCRGELEGEAVRLQLAWLEAQGEEDPFGALGIDAKTLRILESCP